MSSNLSLPSSFFSIIVETGFYYIIEANQAHNHPASASKVQELQGLHFRKPSSSSVMTQGQISSAKLQRLGPLPYTWPMSSGAYGSRTLRRHSQNSVVVRWAATNLKLICDEGPLLRSAGRL